MICRVLSITILCSLPFGMIDPAWGADPPSLADRLSRLPGQLIKDKKTDTEIIDALFDNTLMRAPGQEEKKQVTNYLKKAASREEASRDILWALVNSTEFGMVHGLFNNPQKWQEIQDAISKTREKK